MELREHQKKVIDSIRNDKKPIYFSFPVTKNIDFEKQREGRMHRENSKIIDIVENKKQFLDNVLKDTDVKKQKKNKNRDVR